MLKWLPEKIQNPIAVFNWTHWNKVILTEITDWKWNFFIWAIRIFKDWKVNKINSIRSIYGRNLNQIKRDMKNITFLNKTKMKKWISDNNLDEKEFDFLFNK